MRRNPVAINVKAYLPQMQQADQAIAHLQQQDARLRENREIRPEIIAQRRREAAETAH